MYLSEQDRDSAPEALTVEVRPEMIEAGIDALARYFIDAVETHEHRYASECVVEIFRDMVRLTR